MMNRLTRRQFVYAASASAIATMAASCDKFSDRQQLFSLVDNERLNDISSSETTLQQIAQEKDKIYGAFPEASDEQLEGDVEFQSRLIRECQLLAAGNVWSELYPSLTRPNFRSIDYFSQFARDNNMLFKLDAAVWHEFLPEWLMAKFCDRQTKATEIATILETMVQGVGQRYESQAYAWSVINEVINPADGRSDGFRDTKTSESMKGSRYPSWLHWLGVDFVDLAFRAAATVAPNTILLYNDFGLEYDSPEDEQKRTAVLKLLEGLIKRGTPIQALGVQAHLNASLNDRFNPAKYRRFLQNVADLGLKIQVTELDVADSWLPPGLELEARDRLVAEAYYDYLSVVLAEPAVDTIVTWGLSDRYTWLSWFAPREDRIEVRPLPLDRQLNRKLAWSAIYQAFSEV
ncbi:MAG: endo-1,4-beta-xylanase [Cyanobacteria bacterium J06623_7]